MRIAKPTTHTRRELALRVDGGFEITLYWNRADNGTSVEVYHYATEETLSFPVRGDRALDAFHHPFAYLAAADDATRPSEMHEGEDAAPVFWEGLAN